MRRDETVKGLAICVLIGLSVVSVFADTIGEKDNEYITRVVKLYGSSGGGNPPPAEFGLYLVEDPTIPDDNVIGPFNYSNKKAVRLASSSDYMYFNVDDAYIPQEYEGVDYNCKDVFVSFEVANANLAGNLEVSLEYDGPESGFQKTDKEFLLNSFGMSTDPWVILTFVLPEVVFTNGQHDLADFRLKIETKAGSIADPTKLYVYSISVSRAPGENTSPIFDDFASRVESFPEDEKIVCSYFYHWFNIDTGAHIKYKITEGGEEYYVDRLGNHPSLDGAPGVVYPEYSDFPFPSDFSYHNKSWIKRELRDMAETGIDVALLSYFGFVKDEYGRFRLEDDPNIFTVGLKNVVEARHELIAGGENPPKFGILYEPPACWIDYILKKHKNLLNLTAPPLSEYYNQKEIDRAIFAKYIRDWFSCVPPEDWAAIDGKPLVYIWWPRSAGDVYISDVDESLIPYVKDEFENCFTGVEPYLVFEKRWYSDFFEGSRTMPWDDTNIWVYSSSIPRVFVYGGEPGGARIPAGIIEFNPGFNSPVYDDWPNSTNAYRSREEGNLLARNWYRALKQSRGARFFNLETWNCIGEGTGNLRSLEFGDEAIEINKKYIQRLKFGKEFVVTAPTFNSDDELHYYPSTWIEAPYTLKVYDPATENLIWEIDGLFDEGKDFVGSSLSPASSTNITVDNNDRFRTAPKTDDTTKTTFDEYGMNVCCGDFNGDAFDDIVVAMGPNPNYANQPWLKIFEPGNPIPKCEIWTPFPDLTGGLNIAAGDIDADGVDELVVVPGPNGSMDSGRIMAYDFPATNNPDSNWVPNEMLDEPYVIETWPGGSSVIYGLNVTCGDIDSRVLGYNLPPTSGFPSWEPNPERDYLHEVDNDEIIVSPGYASLGLQRYICPYIYDPATRQIMPYSDYSYIDEGYVSPINPQRIYNNPNHLGGLRLDCSDILKDDTLSVGKEEVIAAEYTADDPNENPTIKAWTYGIPGGNNCRWEETVSLPYTGPNSYLGLNISSLDYFDDGYNEIIYGNTSSNTFEPFGLSKLGMLSPTSGTPLSWEINPVFENPKNPVSVAVGTFDSRGITPWKGTANAKTGLKIKEANIPFVRKPSPNPVNENTVSFTYYNPLGSDIKIELYDVKGRMVLVEAFSADAEKGTIQVNLGRNGS